MTVQFQILAVHTLATQWNRLKQNLSAPLQWEDQHISSNFDMRQGKVFTEFFKGGQTNVCYNCLDRHIEAGRGDQTCFLWEGNESNRDRKMTYKEVLSEVCKVVSFAEAQSRYASAQA